MTDVHACNCMYGSQDPRCCIAKAQRRTLEEAWRLGREGKPLPEPVSYNSSARCWTDGISLGDDE